MNDHFYRLSEEKQAGILNAAFKVFSRSDYKKAPMSEIAGECGISKALLFHYFKNKKELYLYLWQQAMQLTIEATRAYKVTETEDLFEMLERSLRAKCSLMRRYPYVYAFSLKAYYETEPGIRESVAASFSDVSRTSEGKVFERMDQSVFRDGIDLRMMYREIVMVCDGYMFQKYHAGSIDPDEIEADFELLIAHWKNLYLK